MGSQQALVEWLSRAASGDREAFRRLYDDQSARLYGIALRMVRAPSVASDVLQEAFLQAWQNAAKFDASRGTVEGWLVGIVRFRALDALKDGSREVATDDETLVRHADRDPANALQDLNFDTDARALQHCLGLLDPDSRRCLLLAYVEGYSQSQIAGQVGAPLGTVKSWARRGLAALRRCLEQ